MENGHSLARGDKKVSLDKAVSVLVEAERILIVSHRRPDGDCLGSTVGLLLGLRSLGKEVHAYNAGPLRDRWDWLEGIEHVKDAPPEEPCDLTVFVDCGGVDRVAADFTPQGKILNIDHHLSNSCFGDWNYIDVHACAVGEQVYQILRSLNVEVTETIATALYTSVMTDTGCFRFSNTTDRAFSVAGKLVAAGASPGFISQQIYESRSHGEVLLTGIVLSRLSFECGGRAAWSEIKLSDYNNGIVADDEPEGLSSELRSIKGVEVSCLFHEIEGGLRASLRGKGLIDVSAITESLGGGGHFNAAGVTLSMAYDEGRALILEKICEAVKAQHSVS